MPLLDRLGRPLGNLRLPVTDRCNLRCTSCMPDEAYVWLPKGHTPPFAELGALPAPSLAPPPPRSLPQHFTATLSPWRQPLASFGCSCSRPYPPPT